ncbi:uncharacterized protein LOC113277351 isoform X2 [Papaver somniferum]|uniref:uncharacterized protein LOC113277351 isoform X2 n=1 Tax=Papaver somniferum TaxID=3469 RepID=UPI000E7058A8|nr:uncharacterized protein LOC113277351 isoform X2 [Papaver somniferum]
MLFLNNHLFKLFCSLGCMSVKRQLIFEGVRESKYIAQMDNERMKGNVMSVELALQRELEYQKRIENLQKPSDCNSKEHLLPGQGVPSKVALEETRKKFSLQYEACSQDPEFNKQKFEHGSPLKETTIREVTHLQFQEPSTPIQGSLPLAGMKRKTPENFTCSSPQPQQESCTLLNSVPQTVNLLCKVCQVPCSGAANFKQHCAGRKHKNKVEELKHLKNSEDEKELGPVWCHICLVSCMDRSAYKQHVAGKKPAACQTAFNNAIRGQGIETGNRNGKW